MDVLDDEVGTLTVSIAAASVSEGAGPAATTATVSRNSAAPTPLDVTLLSSDTSEATVVGMVTIPANQTTSPAFNINAIDDAIFDGTQTVTITASAASHSDGSDTLDVTDDDTQVLTVSIAAASMSENGGTTTATVSRNSDTTAALTVNLVSNDTSEATVSTPITIAAGQTTSAPFAINAVDDTIDDGTQTVTITATAAGHDDGSDTIDVTDDDAAVLTVNIIAAAFSESAGANATTATVSRNSDTTGPLTVTLSSNDTSEATVTSSITILAGQSTSAPFDIDAVDDAIVDGTQTVTITAVAVAHANGSDTVDVTDDDASGFLVTETDANTLVFEDASTDSFDVVLTARPASDVVIIVSSGDVGEATISPATPLRFTEFNWNMPQTVTVTGVDDPIVDGNQTTLVTLSVDAEASDDAFDELPNQTVNVTTVDVDASIRGTVWDDVDGNQSQNGNELGLSGVTVYLDLNRNGQMDGNEPTQVTDANGDYAFENLAGGEYVVAQIVPTGLAQTYPQVSGDVGTFAELINSESNQAVFVTHAPRDSSRLFVVEQNTGNIRVLDLATGQLGATPFLTIPDVSSSANEAGLLGLTFHPDYANNGKFYVNVNVDNGADPGPFATHIREYRVSDNPDVADAASMREILRFDQPYVNHNGGWLGFSPIDDFLYIATGDGGSAGDPQGNGQNLNTLLGKMLRIDVNSDDFPDDLDANYAIPPSNPFVNGVGTREEIWAYGLRNPWRDSFDRETGDLWIGDVGQGLREEIDFQPASSTGGENYAWNRREGFIAYNGGALLPGDVEPVYDYEHGNGEFKGNSVVGGYVYRGPIEAFSGLYIFADSVTSNVWAFDPADPIDTVQRINDSLAPDLGDIGGAYDIVSFGEDASGNVYLVELDGEIHKISMNLPGTHTVLVAAGEIANDADFGNQDPQLSSIGNLVWHDLNANGAWESTEPGIDEVTVNLLDGTTLAQITSHHDQRWRPLRFRRLGRRRLRDRVCVARCLPVQPRRSGRRVVRQRRGSRFRSDDGDYVGSKHEHRFGRRWDVPTGNDW